MRKYGYLLGAALLLLTGCARSTVPADAGTAPGSSVRESREAENMDQTDHAEESGSGGPEETGKPGETGGTGKTGETGETGKAGGAGKTEESRETKKAAGPEEQYIDALVTYEYLDEWEDSNLILRGTAPVIRILDDGYEELQKALDTYCAERLKSITEDYDSWLPDAKTAYQSLGGDFTGYYLESIAALQRADGRIFSIRQTEGSYFGGAHPNYFAGGVNFDPLSGRKLSLEDVVTDYEKLYEYVKQYLGETAKLDTLFPDYKETLDAYFHEPGFPPLQWVMDSEGLKIVFSPYDLGPYAMGSIEVPVSYEGNDGLIREEYILKGNSLVKKIPAEQIQEIDLDGDGTADRLLITSRDSETNGEPDYRSVITVGSGKEGAELSSTEYLLSGTFSGAYLMRTGKGRSYLYVESDGDNDYRLMDVFDLNGKAPVHVGTVSDTPQGSLLSGTENFTLYTRLDALGTYNGRKRYHVGNDGMPETSDEAYKIYSGGQWDRAITSVRTVPVWMETDGTGKEKVRMELPAGTRFLPVKTDAETYVEAELEDGRHCEIRYELNDSRRTIEGVDEWEYFKDLPYAG